MSVSVYICGVREADGKLGQMVDLKLLCDQNNMSYPPELVEYFEGTEALDLATRDDAIDAATETNLRYDLNIDGLTTGDVEYGRGMLVDLAKLPSDITKLRIYMD